MLINLKWPLKLLTVSKIGFVFISANDAHSEIYAYVSNKKALSSAEAFVAPQFVLQKGLAVEELRDEIYSQLIKQTTENPNRDTLVKYWELLVFCSATFLPTQKLIKYAGAHVQVQQQSEANTGSIAMLAQVCICERFPICN